MCGIFYLRVENIKQSQHQYVEDSFNKIQGRGPDDSQLLKIHNKHKTGNITQYIGFHRLAINGLDSSSNQPMVDNELTLICNGEIYNHKQLLEEYDIVPKSNSDCEIIIHMYRRFGTDFINMLDGVFAFVLIDSDANKMLIARDPIGVRPLFYQKQGSNIAFASEAKALIGLNDIVGGKNAIFKTAGTDNHIVQFPQGSYMVLESNQYGKLINAPSNFQAISYLSTLFYNNPSKVVDRDCRDFSIQHTRELLEWAVSKRLMSDRPIGCLLSGGVDSSIVAALLSRYYKGIGKNIKTFSIGFPDSTDLKYARIVAEHLGTDHHEVVVSYKDALKRIPDVIRDTETNDITTIRASVGMYLLSEYISENFEETVIFSGEGADELLAGYLYFHYADSPEALAAESLRLVQNLPYYDVLRADRCTATHGLELRVPFLDRNFVQFAMSITGDMKQPQWNEHGKIEKFYLRKAFEDMLPAEIIWRRKEGFSDGVGGLAKPWYSWIQEDIESRYPDDHVLFQDEGHLETVGDQVGKFPSREAWYYDYVFRQYYDNVLEPIPEYWMPRWQNTNDPSGRMMKVFEK